MKIYLLLAFDHELPLGGVNNSYQEAIFTPTEQIMDLANSLKIPVNLFTDVLSAIRLKQLGVENEYYYPYIRQLQKAIVEKHDVQLHLHPHWIETTLSGKNFQHTGKYGLSDYSNDNQLGGMEEIIKTGVDFLNHVCKEADSTYKCIAYRAGGFNLFPETKRILQGLFLHGIRIESSINQGFYFHSDFSEVDFSSMPEKSNWFISTSGPLNKEVSSGLLEISIAGKPAGLKTNILHVIKKHIYKNRRYTSGKTINAGHVSIINKLKFVFSTRMLGFDVYTMSSNDLMSILNFSVKKYRMEDPIILSSVSHPKNMGTYSLSLMNEFVEKARKKYKEDIVFTTYQNIYALLKLA